MSAWTLYWITRLNPIHDWLFVVALLGGVILLIVSVVACIEFFEEDFWPIAKKTLFRLWIAWGILTCLSWFIPSTKEAAAIYVIPKIVNNERVNNLADGTMGVLEKYVKEWSEAMTNDKK